MRQVDCNPVGGRRASAAPRPLRRLAALAALVGAPCLTGCVAERAQAVARATETRATSTRVVSDASAPRVATAGVGAPASGKPVNATCPVMLGNPVDPTVTAAWKGVTVAFCDPSARTAWLADPARYAGNLPRLSGSGGAAPVARRRAVPSSARLVAAAAKPAAPTGAAIGSPDGALPAPRRTVVPPEVFSGSPDGALAVVPAAAPAPRKPSAPAAKPAPAKVPALGAGTSPVTPPATPAIEVPGEHGEDEECPGGVCRVPGM